jgi:hypothetical protein
MTDHPPIAPTEPPPGFVADCYTHLWTIPRDRAAVWAWLCDPSTFTDGQVWPYRVEFLDNEEGPGDFRPGVFNAHTGPFMCFAGILGDIEPGRYRDLRYSYGSYALSHRFARPTRLQFWADDTPEGDTRLRLQVDAFVHHRARKVWTSIMKLFWPRFGRWAEKAIPADVD